MHNHIFPALGDRLIGEIRQADIVELLDKVQHHRRLRHMTNRVRETLICLFAYAIERQLIETNPAAATKRRKVEKPRERLLSHDELRALWQVLDRIPEPGRGFVRTLMLTGCRREEARAMQWTELDLEGRLWSLPLAADQGCPRARDTAGRARDGNHRRAAATWRICIHD